MDPDADAAVLAALGSALTAQRNQIRPDDGVQLGLWLRATRGPRSGQWTWATCTSCGLAIVGTSSWWSRGVLVVHAALRPYPHVGCHLDARNRCLLDSAVN